MFTRFEEFAATQMLGHADSPPRSQGRLHFSQDWQRSLFGLTLAISKQGHFEWEDFRRNLIQSIGAWEGLDCAQQPPWDYYERFLLALTQVLAEHEVLSAEEIAGSLTLPSTPSTPCIPSIPSTSSTPSTPSTSVKANP